MDTHLGYSHCDRKAKAQVEAAKSSNHRNGLYTKTVNSGYRAVEVTVPRDRAGTFTPRMVPKGARRLTELDDMIISLYASGMTVCDIQALPHPHYVVGSSARRNSGFVLLAPWRGRLCLSAFLLPCGSGTSRWLRYGLFSSLSENDPGGDATEGSDILQTANRNLTRTECAKSQSNVDASVKYVRPPAMK